MKQNNAVRFIILFFIGSVFSLGNVYGQFKYEQEFRIKYDSLPFKLEHPLKSYPDVQRLKWYKEVNAEDIHYEAKFRFQGIDYSVEFDALGSLEDVELLFKQKNLSTELKSKLSIILTGQYKRWKITRFQKQYLISLETLDAVLSGSALLTDYICNYELELGVFDLGERKSFELLLDNELRLISKKQIVSDPSLNLEF
jgi:hypothetical protein